MAIAHQQQLRHLPHCEGQPDHPVASIVGAWASAQSVEVRDRRVLDDALATTTRRFAADEAVPAPPHWGGLRILPEQVEFWQGRSNRMHDRLRYRRDRDDWTVERLAP